MKQVMTRERLLDYAKRAGVLVLASATREEAEAAIVRALMHASDVEPSPGIGCFGLWADDDSACLTCSYQDDCAEVSLGSSKARAKRLTERADEVRILTAPLRKKTKKKRSRK